MTGKEKCRLLKSIRREFAELNGIAYSPTDCTFDGDCKGTCPKCDAEASYIECELLRLAAEGKSVNWGGLSPDSLLPSIEDDSETSEFSFAELRPTMGVLVPDDPCSQIIEVLDLSDSPPEEDDICGNMTVDPSYYSEIWQEDLVGPGDLD